MIPLFKPYMPNLPLLNTILQSGQLAYGEYVKQFENELKKRFSTDFLIVVNSYGAAISIAAEALGLDFGDEIIMSPMACLVSTQPYAALGLRIKWCDIDNETGTINPDSLRKSITSKTKMIVHNHFCGYLGYIDEINSIAKEYGIPVVDDGIEGFGSKYKGKELGSCGSEVTVFSLSAVRTLNTIEGGIVIFKNKSIYEKALRLRDCGIDRAKFRDDLGEINMECDISEVGYAAMMSNVNAYIGLEQLKYVDKILENQREQAIIWDKCIQNISECTPMKILDSLPNYWVYGVLAKNKRELIKQFRQQGYYASGVHTDNSKYSVFGAKEALLGVEDFNSRFVALPCGWWMKGNG